MLTGIAIVCLVWGPIGCFALGVYRLIDPSKPSASRVSQSKSFIFRTQVDAPDFVLPDTGEIIDSDPVILAAACQNYADFVHDIDLDPGVRIVDDPGLTRSAELLTSEYRNREIAFRVEAMLVRGLSHGNIVDALTRDGVSHGEVATAQRYLDDRREPPRPESLRRFVTYEVTSDLHKVTIVRLEVPSERLSFTSWWSSPKFISVQLPEGAMYRVSVETCAT